MTEDGFDATEQPLNPAATPATQATRRSFLKILSAGVAVAAVDPAATAQPAPKPTPAAPAPPPAANSTDPLDLVNCFQGTDSAFRFSRGNTLPIAAMPFGMAHWTIQSATGTDWFFHVHDQRIQGFRCTHQLAVWLSDYGYATLLPFTGQAFPDPEHRSSSYRHAETVFKPHHVKLNLLRYNCTAELAPTERGAVLRLEFAENDPAGLMIDLPGEDAEFHLDSTSRTLTGITRANAGGVPAGFAATYILRFESPLESFEVKQLGDKPENARRVGVARFAQSAGRTITVRVAHSFISAAQAARNLDIEIGSKSFDQVTEEAHQAWARNLGRIRVEGGTERQNRVFYSALYRAALFPRMWYEPDGQGGFHHFSLYNNKVMPGVMYADHGYWDVYRAWYPLMSILDPVRLGEILQAWVNAAAEGGWLPQFPCPGYRPLMTGSLIDAVFGDAACKNIQGYDVQGAYAALHRHATTPGDLAKGYGRRGIEQYLQLGYMPAEEIYQSAIETLDSAYGDFCIAQVARAAGKPDDARMFEQRSQNWHKVFDPKTGFMRGKHRDGSWLEPFDPFVWGSPYVEGSAWQHRFSAPHDVAGLAQALGGKERLAAALDETLAAPPRFKVGVYEEEIHEMSEMAAVDFGQYAHSNQPVHHVLYLYALAGRPDRTQYWVRRVLNELYTPDTYAGDEDTGSMAAWFIFSALGFYPVCPGRPSYVLGAPLFNRAVITMDDGKQTIIEARDNSSENFYAQSVSVNGAAVNGVEVSHQSIVEGAKLVFAMTSKPAAG